MRSGAPSSFLRKQESRQPPLVILDDLRRTVALTSDYVESLDLVGPNPLLLPQKDDGRGDYFMEKLLSLLP